MIKAIIALITAFAKAIPAIWSWKKHAAKAKAKKQRKKDNEKIIEDVRSGNIDAVADHIAKLLH